MSDTLVFLSYSRRDETLAARVYSTLSAAGLSVWFDQRSIRPGENYAEAIVGAIQQASALVLLFSSSSNNSREIHKEIQLASSLGIPILPVRLDDVAYHPALAYHLATSQWIDGTRNPMEAVDAVIEHLQHAAADPRPVIGTRVAAGRKSPWVIRVAIAISVFTTIALGWLFLKKDVAPSVLSAHDRKMMPTSVSTSHANSRAERQQPTPTPSAPGRPRIAVMYFDFGGGDQRLTGLRKGFADMMVTDLQASGRLNLIERERLEGVLAEIHLQQGAKVDPGTAVRIGKLLGVEYLIFGAYFELLGTLRLDSKMVRVETGEIVASQGVEGPIASFSQLQHALADKVLTVFDVRPAAPRPTQTVSTETVTAYSRILDAIDTGKRDEARVMLTQFRSANPEFLPAQALNPD